MKFNLSFNQFPHLFVGLRASMQKICLDAVNTVDLDFRQVQQKRGGWGREFLDGIMRDLFKENGGCS